MPWLTLCVVAGAALHLVIKGGAFGRGVVLGAAVVALVFI